MAIATIELIANMSSDLEMQKHIYERTSPKLNTIDPPSYVTSFLKRLKLYTEVKDENGQRTRFALLSFLANTISTLPIHPKPIIQRMKLLRLEYPTKCVS